MKNLKEFNSKIEYVLTDIDDTLTTEGQLHSESYSALWKLHAAGIKVIPVTGRPAGWCEMIARQWPVAAVVGENGGFYFRYAGRKMQRWFNAEDQSSSGKSFSENRKKLNAIQTEILIAVPGAAVASDQFCRLMDLAIDFGEDVPVLQPAEIQKIVTIFAAHGAQAKVSSIHVNGWFGNYDKLTTVFQLLKDQFYLNETQALQKCIFVGDSPNDEPLFQKFPHSFGVANVLDFKNSMAHLPTYISTKKGGHGFAEIADQILLLNTV